MNHAQVKIEVASSRPICRAYLVIGGQTCNGITGRGKTESLALANLAARLDDLHQRVIDKQNEYLPEVKR